MEDTVKLSEVIAENPMATFRLTYKGVRYSCKYDRKQGHFYSYVGKKAITMAPSQVRDVKVGGFSRRIGLKVELDDAG